MSLFYLSGAPACYNFPMRILAAVGLSVLILLMTIQVGVFYKKKNQLENQYADIVKQAKQADDEYKSLESDYQYYQNPANLEKELRARFNYRLPDEKLIVIVPKASGTVSSTTSTSQ
jgi:uncharacterized protein YfcZ (UPF0381/DUF406 family)